MNDQWLPWTADMVDNELVTKILEIAKVKEYKKGEILFYQGEISNQFFLLLKGRVEVSVNSIHGKRKIISIHEPHCFTGELIVDKGPRITTAICLSDVKVAVLDTDLSLGSEYFDKKLYMALFHSTNFKLRIQLLQLSEHVFDEVENRVENFLFGLGKNFGTENERHIQVNLPITHQLIADVVGSSRVRVSQILSVLSKEDKIKMRRNEITLLKKRNQI